MLLLALLCCAKGTRGFKEEEFKKCADAGFCRRHRGRPAGKHVYAVEGQPRLSAAGALVAGVTNEATGASFTLEASPYVYAGDGLVRVRMTEAAPAPARFEPADVLLEDLPRRRGRWERIGPSVGGDGGAATTASTGEGALRVVLSHRPLRLEVQAGDNEPLFVLNGQQLLSYEHRRKERSPSDEDGMWEETFRSWTDPKKNGPEAVAFDLALPGSDRVFGLPERAAPFALRPTVASLRAGGGAYSAAAAPGSDGGEGSSSDADGGAGGGVLSEPYRLYNLDVFEYLPDSPFGLYGSVPYLLGLSAATGRTVGAFWLNAAEMFVDVAADPPSPSQPGTATHWMAEAGVLDLFLLAGPTPADVFAQYAGLTGGAELPPLFALGYHQCRWNYRDEADALAVDAGFDEHDMPYDVLWLDIEHTDGKRYMTWDKAAFPDPVGMQNKVRYVLVLFCQGMLLSPHLAPVLL